VPGQELTPESFEQVAAALAQAAAAGRSVHPGGGGTKDDWGAAAPAPDLVLRTAGLNRVLEHNVGDLTAVLEAGVRLEEAQDQFARAGQMLALDPPLGRDRPGDATIGGVLATGDSGPLRHRYGAPRDLVVGITVALTDGTIARAGGKVIKNVAGYDLAKLFTGSFGTLGVILSASVRLHPRPDAAATAVGTTTRSETLARAAIGLASAPLELDCLDVAWSEGRGSLLARSSGAEPAERSKRAAALMRAAGLHPVEVVAEDRELWGRQRAGQRSADAAVVRVATRPSELTQVIAACEASAGRLVGRAALGSSYVELDPGALARLRSELPASAVAVVLDAPGAVRAKLDPWGSGAGTALELMRRVKLRFDPAGACNPGVFVGGI
jgi:glycolate oxidase FAD binding subunit